MLGGRATSWFEHSTGDALDACQHGTMRCCTNLANLLDRLGVHHLICYSGDLHFLDSDGKHSTLCRGPLPAPFHTGLSFLAFKSMSLVDKMSIGRGMLLMLRAKPGQDWDKQDIASWFAKTKQTERAVKRFWEPVLVSACNESLNRISCHHAFKIFREGFLANSYGYEFGVPTVPLGTLYTDAAVKYIQQRGGCVETKTIVDTIEFDENRVTSVSLLNGETVAADYFISALQFDLLLKLLPNELIEKLPFFNLLNQIEFAPLVGVHLWFDRKIDCPEPIALLDRTSDWIFNKTVDFDLPNKNETYLSIVTSADPELTAMPKEQVLERILGEVREALPQTRDANLTKWYVLKERKGTFSPKPGVEALRPDQRSPIKNLYVAGEWTNTGWPSTMESAARSGYLAAERLLEDIGQPTKCLAPDLPVEGLSKWLMRR